jgi:hypothetical protein
MPAKISVAMSKEIGPPERESLGFTCSLEFDEESPAFLCSETFQQAVHRAVIVCQECLHQETVWRA